MRDPRLQYSELQARQQELLEQAARDRLAASQRVNQKAVGGLLTAAGEALLAAARPEGIVHAAGVALVDRFAGRVKFVAEPTGKE